MKRSLLRIGTSHYQMEKTERSSSEQFFLRTKEKNDDVTGKFCGFVNYPNHIHYTRYIGNYVNLYSPLDHEPKEGDFPHIKQLLQHLFKEQFYNEMIYDYFSLLYQRPEIKLPVLWLNSQEQCTGKSTFLRLLKLVFQDNVGQIRYSDVSSNFNSHFAHKLLLINEDFDIKLMRLLISLSRMDNVFWNQKYGMPHLINFYSKFVVESNVYTGFAEKIDAFWIVNTIQIENPDFHFLFDIKKEIPFFVNFIKNREIKYKNPHPKYFFHYKDYSVTL